MNTFTSFKLAIATIGFLTSFSSSANSLSSKIDRHAIVSRNDIIYTKPELTAPLTVGNGKFAFTVDPTGLQTFPEAYNQGLELGTMADYGWHNQPNPENYKIEDTYKEFDAHGRKVKYPYDARRRGHDWESPAAKWMYENPSRIGLGQIGLILTKANGSSPSISDLQNIHQHLELWSGTLTSYFELEGQAVKVQTIVHPSLDMIAIQIESPLINVNRLKVVLNFPYANNAWSGSPNDWDNPDKHTTNIVSQTDTRIDFSRKLDNENYSEDEYLCAVNYPKSVTTTQKSTHQFVFTADPKSSNLQLGIAFASKNRPPELPKFKDTYAATVNYWNSYWKTGAFIDLSESKDTRWKELEKRIVLSQYVMAVNCVSNRPPQETGLVQRTWHGKFHLEMVWFHEAHFALWDRLPLMMKSMEYYKEILPSARKRAQLQGYKGARWPKMTGPEGRESPNFINPFLTWQQAHPIYFAELNYRKAPTTKTLNYWWELVKETADFMASFVVFNPETGIYDVGPPLNDVHEDSEIGGTKNTPYEVAYFRFGLEIANKWRERMGFPPDSLWNDIVAHLAPLESENEKYLAPAIMFATLPLPHNINKSILDSTVIHWVKNLPEHTCSWHYPVTAMASARALRPDLAVEALLFPSKCNTVSSAGYNFWAKNVPVYLPGNGALLEAVAMMVGGWDGAPKRNAPGFPENGQWVIKSEGLQSMP